MQTTAAILHWCRRCCEFQSEKKGKKRDAVVIDKVENVKEVIHERERGNGEIGQSKRNEMAKGGTNAEERRKTGQKMDGVSVD